MRPIALPIYFGLMASFGMASYAAAQDTTLETVPSGWDICNETSYILRLATASIVDGKMTPQGWSKLRPGGCLNVDAPPDTPRYLYAESSPVHQGGVREWKGTVELCSSEEDFKADATISCPLQDLGTRPYKEVDPGEQKTTLVEPDDYGKNANMAGIQRLLRDNGYSVRRIDGLKGRRTTNPLNKFLKSVKKKTNISIPEKIDALEDGARQKQSEIGFTVCNESSEKIWSSVAFREDGKWESRGWWPVQVNECIRPFTRILKKTEAHYFALQEDTSAAPNEEQKLDKRLKSTAVTPSQFCIAESRFAATGRDFCSDRGYIAANFRPLPNDKEGAKVNLTDADFAEINSTGLRR